LLKFDFLAIVPQLILAQSRQKKRGKYSKKKYFQLLIFGLIKMDSKKRDFEKGYFKQKLF
jgi:uncharacterized protein YhhL (DUF1145 family)